MGKGLGLQATGVATEVVGQPPAHHQLAGQPPLRFQHHGNGLREGGLGGGGWRTVITAQVGFGYRPRGRAEQSASSSAQSPAMLTKLLIAASHKAVGSRAGVFQILEEVHPPLSEKVWSAPPPWYFEMGKNTAKKNPCLFKRELWRRQQQTNQDRDNFFPCILSSTGNPGNFSPA